MSECLGDASEAIKRALAFQVGRKQVRILFRTTFKIGFKKFQEDFGELDESEAKGKREEVLNQVKKYCFPLISTKTILTFFKKSVAPDAERCGGQETEGG